jgi:hypothetical protein
VSTAVKFSHRELSLALFALEGGELPATVEDPCSPDEHACPVVDSLEEMFGGRKLTLEKKLARHLVKHLQEGWIECGLMELGQPGMTQPGPVSGELGAIVDDNRRGEQQFAGKQMAQSLSKWNCEIELGQDERLLLSRALGRLPRAAWISMPRTMWRLRRKLKD